MRDKKITSKPARLNNKTKVAAIFRYTKKIENRRNEVILICNWPKDKILSIERCHIGLASEQTVIVLDIPTKNEPYTVWYYEISREQHNNVIKNYVSKI